MCICMDSADRLQGNEKGNSLRIMRRKAADNERTCYLFTVEKNIHKKTRHDIIKNNRKH